jgi:hypothetical protein
MGLQSIFQSFMGNFLYKTLLYDGEYSRISLDYFQSSNHVRGNLHLGSIFNLSCVRVLDSLENILLHKQVLAALNDQTLEAQPARCPHHGHLQQDYRWLQTQRC